jgi:hypothetical protein
LAIPDRPNFLPPVLQDVIAPVVNTPAAPSIPTTPNVPAATPGVVQGNYRDANWYRAQRAAQQALPLEERLGAQNWPDWLRKAYGLAPTGRDTYMRGLEDQTANYRAGISKTLSADALSWAQQQPYLQLWARSQTANAPASPEATKFPLLTSLLTNS